MIVFSLNSSYLGKATILLLDRQINIKDVDNVEVHFYARLSVHNQAIGPKNERMFLNFVTWFIF
jgi:hypothetical protein